jgi:hypothetical protein
MGGWCSRLPGGTREDGSCGGVTGGSREKRISHAHLGPADGSIVEKICNSIGIQRTRKFSNQHLGVIL